MKCGFENKYKTKVLIKQNPKVKYICLTNFTNVLEQLVEIQKIRSLKPDMIRSGKNFEIPIWKKIRPGLRGLKHAFSF